MKVIWIESDTLEAGGGHGVDFFAVDRPHPEGLVAVLRGFEWYHGKPETVEVSIRATGFDEEFLEEARTSIEHYVANPDMLRSHIEPSPKVRAGING